MKRFLTQILPLSSILLLSALVLSACAQLAKQDFISKPTAKLLGAHVANLNADSIDLVFDLAVDNKNPVGLNLAGLDYNFQVENQSLVSGKNASKMQLKSNATSNLALPISLKFSDLKKLYGSLKNKDNINYQLKSNLFVNLPVIGKYAIPISSTGVMPVPKTPEISVKNIDVKNLSFSSADVVTQIEINNANNFAIDLNNFNYKLNVNQQNWGQGNISQKTQLPKKGKAVIAIPVKLNLKTIGLTAYKMLLKKAPVEYKLTGNTNLGTGLKLLKNFNMPVNVSGSTRTK